MMLQMEMAIELDFDGLKLRQQQPALRRYSWKTIA